MTALPVPDYDTSEREAIEAEPRPLDGLDRLARVAVVGYDDLVARTAQPIRWVWHAVISEANHTEISGPSGGGKTTLASLFVAALASRQIVRLFGRDVTPVRAGQYVVLIEEENGVHSVRRKLEAACEALNIQTKATLDRVIVIVRQRVRVGDAVWGELVELGKRGGIGAVFIDSRARVLRNGESNREEDQAAVADAVFGLVEASHAPVFVISHTRKGNAEAIEDIAGSGQRGAGADVILLVNPKRDSRGCVTSSTITFVKIRDDVEEHPDPVEFTLAKDTDGAWSLSSSAVEVPDDREVHERLREFLDRNGPQTKFSLRRSLKMGSQILEAALSRLFADRAITTQEQIVGGRARTVFALRRPQ